MFADVEPPHRFVRETSASVVHHADYLNHRDDRALCGVAFENPATLAQTGRTDAMCPDCETQLVVYQLEWWRGRAQAATAELEELRVKYRELQEYADTQRRQSAPARVGEVPSGEISASEQAEAEPKTLLDHARRQVVALCRQFDGAVPFVRLKNAMQEFSDKLDTGERVLLAQEIGGDGTLIRWSTTEVEALGWQVTNNPIQGESAATWDAWIQDSYQAPSKNKWRLGRSR
jgi:hypothetical protein